jgi:hypothetical protein
LKDKSSLCLFGLRSEGCLIQSFYFLSVVIFVIAILGCIILPSSFLLLIIVALLSIFLLLVSTISILYFYYSSHPSAIQKRHLTQQLKQYQRDNESVLTGLQIQKMELQKSISDLDSKEQAAEQFYNKQIGDLGKRIRELSNEMEIMVRRKLESYQQEWIHISLQNNLIEKAGIPGIGKVLAERLEEQRISTADDIEAIRLANVPGIGDKKSRALINWRIVLERQLVAIKPARLPEEVENSIRYEYQNKINDAEKKIIEHQQRHELDVIAFASSRSEMHKIFIGKEDKTKEEIRIIKEKINSQKDDLTKLEGVTFGRYLRESLQYPVWTIKKPTPLLITNGVLFFVCICTLCGSETGAMGIGIHNNLPTSTFTPSITSSSTVTFTPSMTFTPSITKTPTITQTPTIMLTFTTTATPSSTFTPTNTPTNSITPTRTKTITFTRTITNTRFPTATPAPERLVRCGAICRDGWRSSSTGSGTCSHHGGVSQWLYCPA